ncbi:MAG: MtrB/PioB family outer membrane beta-barrel protein [Sulfuritalea sp.]|nr:MtrB/PioB family outer membrane beta-barrel protein [Sulfuritalea sp.]
MGGDQRNGSYLDLDLSIVGKNAQRNVFELERQGFGAHNHRGTVRANSDTLGFNGYYTNFRTATSGLWFLYSPNQVPGGTDPLYFPGGSANTNTGYVALFNNDSPGQTLYKVDRTTYGLGLALKPTLFGNSLAAAINYDGYKRDGNRFATYVSGGGDITGPGIATSRWRGFDMPVDERMNRYTISLNGAPGGFNLGYEGSIEKFDNKARNFGMADFASATFVLSAAGLTKPLHFIPDSTLISNNFRFAKNYGSTAVAAGYGLSVLEQDSFAPIQQTQQFNVGKITTNSAYLNVTSNALSGVGLEGFVKYNNRDNDSTFPAGTMLNATHGERLDVRIDRIKALSYGLAATLRPAVWKSSVTLGWQHDDKDRDLTWSLATITSIQPHETLYREETKSDELYLKWIARPMPGMILRVTPAYTTANQTGLIGEPDKAFSLKSKLSYTEKSGMMVSGFYNHRNAKNANNAYTDSTAGGAPAAIATKQDNDRTQNAAGVSLNMPFGEWINTTASLSWLQDDFSSYFLRSDKRRYEGGQNVLFANADRSNYNIDTYLFTLGGDWQVSDELRWNGAYTWSKSKGNTASGYIFDQLAAGNSIDGSISSAVHSLNLGVDYQLKKNVKLKAAYVYDYNKDDSYAALTGGYHTLMMGVGFGF